jgi:hypothetical protein
MLNRPLYEVLRSRFGTVKVSNENVRRIEVTGRDGKKDPIVRGESYSTSCPMCGDTKCRLSISYLWLEKEMLSNRRRTELAHCYNENCDVRNPKFWEPILEDVEKAKLGTFFYREEETITVPREFVKIRMPAGCVRIDTLESNHPACEFIRKQYAGLPPEYLGKCYGAAYTSSDDLLYPLAKDRVIFPIYKDGDLIAWQGRTINNEVEPRWYIPPGFVKPVYNLDNVAKNEVPIVAEGIPSAIACGPKGVALFGKEITQQQVDLLKKCRCCIVATDPETFVIDSRGTKPTIFADKLKMKLDKALALPSVPLQWPQELLELAKRKVAGEDVKVPDPADLGPNYMQELIRKAMHAVI